MALFDEPRPKGKAGARLLAAAGVAVLALALAAACALRTMQEKASPSPAPEKAEAGEQADADGFADVDWDWWRSVNPDVVAWVQVPGTSISQPVCQAPADDPDYYNSHDVYREWNPLGCPFLHADNAAGGVAGSQNAVIQGHNISSSESPVFAELASYAEEPFAEEHPFILLQTPDVKLTLTPFCVELVPNAGSADVLATGFDSDAQFERYVQERMQASALVLADPPSRQMWTLSTCSYYLTPSNERTVVHCKAVGTEKAASGEGGES